MSGAIPILSFAHKHLCALITRVRGAKPLILDYSSLSVKRLRALKRTRVPHIVAWPPPSAVSLWLTVGQNDFFMRLRLRIVRGVASGIFLISRAGKPEAYRTVLRQSRNATALYPLLLALRP